MTSSLPESEHTPDGDEMPPDLLRTLEDPSIVIRQDAAVFELLAKWQKARPATESAEAALAFYADPASYHSKRAQNADPITVDSGGRARAALALHLAEQPREHGPDHPTHKHPRVPGEPYCPCFEHGFHVCSAEHWAVLCGEINYERRVAEQEGFSGRQAAVDWLLTTDIHAQGSESARRDFARRTVDRILALTT